jgi:plasmid maintenance system antidote protein VapI
MAIVNKSEIVTLPSIVTQDLATAMGEAMKEMSKSFTRVDAEKDLQKDIASRMNDEYGVPKQVFNKMAKLYYAANLAQEEAKNEEFMEFTRSVFSMIGAPGIGYNGEGEE